MNWQSTQRVLYRNALIHSSDASRHAAMIVDGDRIAWLGDESPGAAPAFDLVLDLEGAVVAPGLVDAHIEGLQAGSAAELTALRDQAGRLGFVALHDFSTTQAALIGDQIVERPGTLVYPFRRVHDTAAFGAVCAPDAHDEWRAAIEAGLPLAITWNDDDDADALAAGLAGLAARVGLERLRRAATRLEVVSRSAGPLPEAVGQYALTVIGSVAGTSGAWGSFSAAPGSPWIDLAGGAADPSGPGLSAALTRGSARAWQALGRPAVGRLEVGAPAHLAMWSPSLTTASVLAEPPQCLRTVIAGTIVHDAGVLPR
ncbi:MAG: hypothetical protein PHU75_11815 [Candidatus Nanopelagicales bacterium]|nr:hypothetical protein [Candidatus Nanopelagicales bacterium]